MVNPGIFRGTRFAFLVSEKASYKAGVDGGYAADALAKIQSRYFRRYPVELSLDEEPSAEFLKAVDDERPDVDQQVPDPEKLTVDEYKAEVERLRQRADLITVRKAVSCDCLFWRPPSLMNPIANQTLDVPPIYERPRSGSR